jgi:endoglucanase
MVALTRCQPRCCRRFDLRILVPCYKEDLEVVENTVKAILNADFPHNTTRTVYLCDDGQDPLKREFASRVSDVVYVTGRYREKGGWLVGGSSTP